MENQNIFTAMFLEINYQKHIEEENIMKYSYLYDAYERKPKKNYLFGGPGCRNKIVLKK